MRPSLYSALGALGVLVSVPGCFRCACAPAWVDGSAPADAESGSAGDGAADGTTGPCVADPITVGYGVGGDGDIAWSPALAGAYVAWWNGGGTSARFLPLGAPLTFEEIVASVGSGSSWVTAFGDGSALLLEDVLDFHAIRFDPVDILWDIRVAPVALPLQSDLSDFPVRLQDGNVAFSYRYRPAEMEDWLYRRAVYGTGGLVTEVATSGAGRACPDWLFNRAHDGDGGCWVSSTVGNDPYHFFLQHYALDGAPIFAPPGIEIAPPDALRGHVALVANSLGGVYETYLAPLAPGEPVPDKLTSPRAVLLHRFADTGELLWSTRADGTDGPKAGDASGPTDYYPCFHATAPDGRVVTSWYDLSTGAPRCFAQALDAAGNVLAGPGGVELSGPYVGLCNSGLVIDCRAYADDAGITVAWPTGNDATDYYFHVARFDWSLAAAWPEPVTLNCAPVNDRARFETDGSGGVLVLWWDEEEDGGAVYLQRVRADGSVGFDG